MMPRHPVGMVLLVAVWAAVLVLANVAYRAGQRDGLDSMDE